MSNQTKPAPPKIVVAPEGCNKNLTAGKEYEVVRIFDGYQDPYGYGFYIIDDYGDRIVCLERNCGFAKFYWIIKEREVSHD